MAQDNNVIIIIKRHDDSNGGHPHIILDNIDDKYVSVGLTTTPKKGKNHPNIKLDNDPLGQGKPSYMRRQGTVDQHSRYHDQIPGVMSPEEYEKAKQIGEKAKQKYIKHKKQKK